jgi:NADH:ubiquinone oxidoreductase subunit K
MSTAPFLGLYLGISAILFGIGLAGVLMRRNAILILIGVEMMMNAANLNFLAFWHFNPNPTAVMGQMFALFGIAVAGAEAAVGLALVIAVYRHFRSVNVEKIDVLKG